MASDSHLPEWLGPELERLANTAGNAHLATGIDAILNRLAAEAPPVDELVRQAVANAAGVRTRWIEPLAQELDRLIQAAQDQAIDDDTLMTFLADAARNLPDLFAAIDAGSLADSLEEYLGAAALQGVTRSMM